MVMLSRMNAVRAFPPLLSNAGIKVETVISTPNLNCGMHHVKLVIIAEIASHMAKDLFQSFFRMANKLCWQLRVMCETAKRENRPSSMAAACIQRASGPSLKPKPKRTRKANKKKLTKTDLKDD